MLSCSTLCASPQDDLWTWDDTREVTCNWFAVRAMTVAGNNTDPATLYGEYTLTHPPQTVNIAYHIVGLGLHPQLLPPPTCMTGFSCSVAALHM